MNRRGFLQGILAAGMAPAIVKAEILMPVRKIIVPPTLTFRRYVPYGSSVIALDHVIDSQRYLNGWWRSALDGMAIDPGAKITLAEMERIKAHLLKGRA